MGHTSRFVLDRGLLVGECRPRGGAAPRIAGCFHNEGEEPELDGGGMGLFDKVRGLFGAKRPDDRRARARSPVKRGTQILIIDDSTTVVTMLRRMLEQNGYEPIEAFDAESGIQLAKQHLPRLIFLDIVLPGMNGFAALRTLRRNPLTAEIPVIMMSGNEQATEQFWAQKIGADDFMKKPFSRAEVFVRIDRVLSKRAPAT